MTMMTDEAIPTEAEDGVWPARRRKVLDWLVNDTRQQRFVDNILIGMCERLVDAGVPVARASFHFQANHPQWRGARLLWRTGMDEADVDFYGYEVEKTQAFLMSPLKVIHDGADELRKNLEEPVIDPGSESSLYAELRAEGLTEYVALPLDHTLDKRHVVTFSTARKGGFAEPHISFLRDLLPVLALITEIRVKNILARTLLRTYVGPHASEAILAGATTRGSGATMNAAIMICDLRDFTTLSSLWPRDYVIDLLNGYFDAISGPIEEHGGEILKFMGDGLLAVFPLSVPTACGDLLSAIKAGRAAMAALNEKSAEKGHPHLGYGVGVHLGEVMYGNIGSQKRLDFTVIGPAVNLASRLETLTKEVKRPVLMSKAFVEKAGCASEVDGLGVFTLKGIETPVDVFALKIG
ncbi:adenylate/guanylate cyclase domain-containing protein [Rhizobium sp. KVB221]|uniref:Adenylate/guanylate cyclase domain-containing protein n=1 Tax=Rhizobium setariae TaxID=2801340 RepID=A0A937CP65_9HYPH|nr:adenylate/guanylate cyclase domain-containing protein [Rhizobium setariae]MBL0372068.1 adenylate/guanylate cyclase domain-containing protein [Rhizobium setariae]